MIGMNKNKDKKKNVESMPSDVILASGKMNIHSSP